MFNNTAFNSAMMSPMHAQMKRLYDAARALKGKEGQSEVARLLNMSPQTLNNWEARGISSNGILLSAQLLGCNATWLRSGEGELVERASSGRLVDLNSLPFYILEDELKTLLALRRAPERVRKAILNALEKMPVNERQQLGGVFDEDDEKALGSLLHFRNKD